MPFDRELVDAEKEELTKAFKQFVEGPLLLGDFEIGLEVIDDDVIGIGMGEQGCYLNKEEQRGIFNAVQKDDSSSEEVEVTEAPSIKTSIDYSDIDVRVFTPTSATVSGKIHVTTEIDGNASTMSLLQMFAAAKQNGQWKFHMVAAAHLDLTEDGIESYQYSFADSALAQLRADIESDSFQLFNRGFSGGVMCTYIKENYPLCFANDSFVKMLGYEREEFEEYFKDNTVKMNAPESEEHMEQVSTEGEQGGDFGSRACWLKKDGSKIWVEFRATRSQDPQGNPIFLSVSIDVTETVELEIKNRIQHETILSSVNYASKIQRSLLPKREIFEKAFSDSAVLWQPRDMVGGDIYWAKSFEQGTVLGVCDCTGHGVPGALLTMLVRSSLEEAVTAENCTDTAEILWELDQKFQAVFDRANKEQKLNEINDSCEASILYIAKNGDVTISASNIYMFICDGKEVQRLKGQKIQIGEGKLESKDIIKTTVIPYHPDNKFYVTSDGFIDQAGHDTKRPFGTRKVMDVILKNHNQDLRTTVNELWKTFQEFKGTKMQRDDAEIVCFKP